MTLPTKRDYVELAILLAAGLILNIVFDFPSWFVWAIAVVGTLWLAIYQIVRRERGSKLHDDAKS